MKGIVLGSSSGLGQYLTERLRTSGWRVVGVSRHPSHDDDVALDLQSPNAPEELLQVLQFQQPDLVVNCAVIYPKLGEDEPSPTNLVREIQRQFVVNAAVPYAAIDAWIRHGGFEQQCVYIHCSSDAVYSVQPVSAGYPASKLAAHALVNALAKRAKGSRLAVSTLLLGPLATPPKLAELRRIAVARQWSLKHTTEVYLSRANPNYVQTKLIELRTCFAAVKFLHDAGAQANGALIRLDAGAGGAGV